MGKPKKRLSEETLVIAYRLREARAKKFKTIKEAADALPAQKTLWSHWENAFVRPQDATIEKIAALLDVSIEFLHRKPDDWEEEKRRFLAELIARTRAKKDYYNSFKASLRDTRDAGQTPPAVGNKANAADVMGVFLQIASLISDAQNKVIQGEIDKDAYYAHMQMIADMVKVIMFTRK